MRKILTLAALPLLLAACGTAPPVGSFSAPNAPVRMTVSDPVAGIAQIALDDAAAAKAELLAAGANLSTAPMSLQDSYTCSVWIHDVAIPQAQQIVAGLAPGGFNPKGAYSLFIAGKIAYIKGKGAISSAQSTFIDNFNHFCGAALAGDVNAINMMLLKVGISVAVPGGGILGGLIPGVAMIDGLRDHYEPLDHRVGSVIAALLALLLLVVAVVIMLALPAQAQMSLDMLCPCISHPVERRATGDAELDRAVSLCERHKGSALFEHGWEGCQYVIDAWGRSDTAQRLHEQAEQEARDLAFVKEYSQRLKERGR